MAKVVLQINIPTRHCALSKIMVELNAALSLFRSGAESYLMSPKLQKY
jgi:hypothetical protein